MVGARLQSNLVYGLKGKSLGPGTKLAGSLAFGAIMSKVALNHRPVSRRLSILPRDGGSTSAYDRKGGEAIYLYWLTDDVCLLAGQRSMNKRRGELHALVRCDS